MSWWVAQQVCPGLLNKRTALLRGSHVQGSSLHDLLTPMGMIVSVGALLRLTRGALVHLATCCTSYAWINAGCHKRSWTRPLGDESLAHVRAGNALAARATVLAILAWSRNLPWAIEKPQNSSLVVHPLMQRMLAFFRDMRREFGVSVIFQHTCCLGSFGGTSLKPIWLYSHMDLTYVMQQAEAFFYSAGASGSWCCYPKHCDCAGTCRQYDRLGP